MERSLGTAELIGGDSLRLLAVEAPDASWASRLAALLGHKPPVYLGHVRAALAGPLDRLRTIFYVGAVGETPITVAMVTGADGAGVFGHVYTVPDWRRRGASEALHRALVPDVRALGFRCLTLGTNPEGHARRIYERAGFRCVTPGSGSMLWGDGKPPEGAYAIGPAAWADWGWVSAAGCAPLAGDEDRPRSVLLDLGGPGHVEGPFARALQEARPLRILRRAGAAVGWAEFSPLAGALLGGVALDFYVRPDCWAGAPLLLQTLDWPRRPVVAAAAGPRASVLAASGFEAAGSLPALGGRPLWVRSPR